MTPFLLQVVRHWFEASGMGDKCFVFPNNRALTFFRNYLKDEVAASGVPCIAPQMYTMDDFICRMDGAVKADRVGLLLELYKCYSALIQNPEPVDEFIFWGDVILSDFNDIDKYLVDASRLLVNVSEFKQMQDPLTYMSEKQLDAMNRFIRNFDQMRVVKRDFLRTWEILLPLYNSFRAALESKGLAYEGQIYRRIASSLDEKSVVDVLSGTFGDVKKYVFVGLNALNECEKKILRRMRDAGVAECCWDYSSEMIRSPQNRSSHFIEKNMEQFGQAIDLVNEPLPDTEFNVISVPSGVGQAKLLPEIFRRLSAGGAVSADTAVVIPDEDLLMSVINSLPPEVSMVNVTMGYPMTSSQLWSLMNDIAALQMHIRVKDGAVMFYHRQVWAIFSNSVFKSVLSPEAAAIVEKVKGGHKYYVPQEEFAGDAILENIFRQAGADSALLADYQKSILAAVGFALKSVEKMTLELDFAMLYYKAVSIVRRYSPSIRPATYFRLVEQLVSRMSVPFHGEPVQGLQIMGPLETRCLDFDNLVILSCNEGMFPRRSVASSFIPPELRKGFDLPTYEYQDAVWAYYFYRLIQRSGKVWMLYDSRTEKSLTGEESRYIKQLELDFGCRINRYVMHSPISGNAVSDAPVRKTAEHIRKIRSSYLSASSLQNYISCPAMFFYGKVEGLEEKEEVSEALDSAMLGKVFHSTMQELYAVPGGKVGREYLQSVLKDDERIASIVRGHIMEELSTSEVEGRNIIYEDIVCKYVRRALESDIALLKERCSDGIDILGLELCVKGEICGQRFIGYIDRLDSVVGAEVRIVDYKTGRVSDNDFLISDENAEAVVEAVFSEDENARLKIPLQLYLYDRLVRLDAEAAALVRGRRTVNSIYQTNRLFVKDIEEVSLSPRFGELMSDRLESLIEEILSPDKDFRRIGGPKTCSMCKFKTICGK